MALPNTQNLATAFPIATEIVNLPIANFAQPQQQQQQEFLQEFEQFLQQQQREFLQEYEQQLQEQLIQTSDLLRNRMYIILNELHSVSFSLLLLLNVSFTLEEHRSV